MATHLDEGFENTGSPGYDEAGWSETVDASCTVDENSSIPGSPPSGLGSQCLKCETINLGSNDAYIENTEVCTVNTTYLRFYIYIDTLGIESAEYVYLFWIKDSDGWESIIVRLHVSGTDPELRFYYFDNGGWASDTEVILVDTWYRVELKYDTSGMAWEWKIDGDSKGSGSLTGSVRGNMEDILIGLNGNQADSTTTIYFDEVLWSDSDWPGEATTEDINKKENIKTTMYLLELDDMRGNPDNMGGMKWR